MNIRITYWITLLFFVSLSSCTKDDLEPTDNSERIQNPYSTSSDHILINDTILEIKGVVYVPGYPGYLPWELENLPFLQSYLKESILNDTRGIKNIGANTIRLWGAPKFCYESIKQEGGLHILQTIWIDGAVEDFHEVSFKEDTKQYIKEVVDRIYSVYTDNNPPLLAYLIGNELSNSSILKTDASHPEIKHFSGNFITALNRTPSEIFIAEMADFLLTYEWENYGRRSLVSYANDIRTADIFDTPFLDFRSHNAYSYAVPYYRPNTLPGSSSGTYFQGWVEELKSLHPDIPLLITETGLSVAPNAPHIGPPNYGYGGNTIEEQSEGIVQNLEDVKSSDLPVAGVCIHEYLDAWWKFGLEDSYSQDPDDVEEWFGIAKIKPASDWYTTEYKEAYYAIQESWN